MGITAMTVGGAFGIVAKGTVNRLMKVSLRRAPWEYVLGAGIGAYVGNKIPQWEATLISDINEMRADRNMPPATRVGGYEFGSSITGSK
ncbi:unnamed protein product [Ectocarpus sp. 6 AP-2014]